MDEGSSDSAIGALTEQVYHYDLDFDQIWEEGAEEGLLGVYFALADESGQQRSNENVYVPNPAEQHPAVGSVRLSYTDSEDPGKALSGAVFAVYSGTERVGTLEETSAGVYELSGLPAGEYTVKLETAPDGYESGGEYAFAISENGQVAELAVSGKALQPPEPDDPVTPDKPDEPVTPDKPDDPVTPDKPDEPVIPDKPDEPVTPDKPDRPATGDSADYWLWIALGALSIAAIITLVVTGKKKH